MLGPNIKAAVGQQRVTSSPLKLFAMPIKEGVEPHQKLSAAGTLIDAAKDGLTACFLSIRFRFT